MSQRIAIIDYGSGNLRSVEKALDRAAREAGLAALTCVTDDPTPRLRDAATQLSATHGVRTYVIGYNFFDDTAQLDALAEAGGTSYSAPIQVGNEAALLEAFQGVVEDIKLCTE